jgi:hypothetical protein
MLREGVGMSELLEMEPRLAGTDVVEPIVEFENGWSDQSDSARCPLTVPHRTGFC